MTDSSDKKLYVVTFAMDMVVAATSPEEAKAIARRHQFEEEPNLDIDESKEMAYLPGMWDLDATVYGTPKRTLRQWIDAGVAPKYVDNRDRLLAAHAKAVATGLVKATP